MFREILIATVIIFSGAIISGNLWANDSTEVTVNIQTWQDYANKGDSAYNTLQYDSTINSFITQAVVYRENGKNDSAMFIAQQARQMYNEHPEIVDTTIAKVYGTLSWCFLNKSNLDSSDYYANKAYITFQNIKEPNRLNLLTILGNFARINFVRKNYDSAQVILEKTLVISKEIYGPNDLMVAKAILNLATIYKENSNYVEAERLFLESLPLLEEDLGSEHQIVAVNLNNLGVLYHELGQLDKAEYYQKRALAIREKVFGEDHLEVGKSLINLANIYKSKGKYIDAERINKRAYDILVEILGTNHHYVYLNLIGRGDICRDLGKYSESEKAYLQALEISSVIFNSDHPNIAESLTHLADLYRYMGRYSEIHPLLKRASKIYENAYGPNSRQMIECYRHLAIVYRVQGLYSKSESLLLKALDIGKEILEQNHPFIVELMNGLAITYRHLGQYDEAESLYKICISSQKDLYSSDNPTMVIYMINLANLYVDMDVLPEAEQLYLDALAIYDNLDIVYDPNIAQILGSLAEVYYGMGKYHEAEIQVTQALNIYETLFGRHPDATNCELVLAKIYASLNQMDNSKSHYENFLSLRREFIGYSFSFSSEEQKLNWIRNYPIFDNSLISLAITTGDERFKKLALEMTLNNKAIVLDAIMAEKKAIYCSNDTVISEIIDELEIIRTQIANTVLSNAFVEENDKPSVGLKELLEKNDSLEVILAQHCQELGNKNIYRGSIIPALVNIFPQNALLCEFQKYQPYDFKTNGNRESEGNAERYIVYSLNSLGEINIYDVGNSNEIDSLVSLTRSMIYESEGEVYSGVASIIEERLSTITKQLYNKLLEPLMTHLDGKTELYISPDGMLNLLPFEMLSTPDGSYVIEKYKISYLSSGRDLLKFKNESQQNADAIIIADPDYDGASLDSLVLAINTTPSNSLFSLSNGQSFRGSINCLDGNFKPLMYGRTEATSIMQTFDNSKSSLNVNDYYGNEATEELLKQLTEPPKVLHIVTHGFFCEIVDSTTKLILNNPLLRSGIALTGANNTINSEEEYISQSEDGILTAFEVSGMNLISTELVTLSACETGVGEFVNGEGVFGLRRSFQHAGARSILMSLWKVPDKETSELMDGFYERWLGGMSKRDALRESALDIIRNSREKRGSAHPLLWGGFVLTGNPK